MFRALRQGLRHLFAAPGLVVLVWFAGLVVALPAAIVVEEAIHGSVARSLVAESLRDGFDTGWFGEFKASAAGLAATLAPSQVGVGATLDVLDRWWDGSIFSLEPAVVAFGVVFALVWLLLLGGVMSRLRRPWDVQSLRDVLAEGGRYFWAFLRLSVLVAPLYYGIIRLAAWLFPWIETATRDLTSERSVLLINLAAALVIVGLVATVRLIVDYARVSMVVEGRQGALAGATRGLGFVARHALAAYALQAIFALLTVGLLAVYAAIAPGVGESRPLTIALAIAGSQLYVMTRWALRVGLLSSELALFQERTRRRM